MNLFKNPYLYPFQSYAGPDKNLYRAPASIGKEDYEFIRGIRPITGTVITTQNLLWQKLVTSLKNANITDMSHQSEFESFVANLTITDNRPSVSRGTAGRNGGKTAVGNDGSRTPRTRTKNPKPKDSKSITPS